MRLIRCEVISNKAIQKDIHKVAFKSEYISKCARPGQFVHIKMHKYSSAILRRPISIAAIDIKDNLVTIFIKIKGKGTELICGVKPGEYLDILGPCGTFFDVPDHAEHILLIGGGIGSAPLLFAAQYYSHMSITALLGFRSIDSMFAISEFKKTAADLIICTDDASMGCKGNVSDVLHKHLQTNRYHIALSCGPTAMFKAIKGILNKASIPCQISLEQNMGCGIGACMGCACKIKTKDGYVYKRVCKDGPVFYADEVILDG